MPLRGFIRSAIIDADGAKRRHTSDTSEIGSTIYNARQKEPAAHIYSDIHLLTPTAPRPNNDSNVHCNVIGYFHSVQLEEIKNIVYVCHVPGSPIINLCVAYRTII